MHGADPISLQKNLDTPSQNILSPAVLRSVFLTYYFFSYQALLLLLETRITHLFSLQQQSLIINYYIYNLREASLFIRLSVYFLIFYGASTGSTD